MTESTLQLEIPVLLPGVADERDSCVQRLNEQLAAQKGIQQAHIERANGEARVCLHYDPNLLTLDGRATPGATGRRPDHQPVPPHPPDD